MSNSSPEHIRDIPGIKKLQEQMKNIRTFKAVMPFMRLLKPFGVDTAKMEAALNEDTLKELEEMMNEISTVPDKFNEHFASLGWIIYEDMNLTVAKEAIEAADMGNTARAEEILVEYYSPETVKFHLRRMNSIPAFRLRMRLANLAFDDYKASRYHACIPVVLAMMDGLVNELHEQRKGFFADGVELEAWDSIAAHSKGLGVLIKLFNKGRRKTRDEVITIPYRHGIIHGLDLGYDNQLVAAKAWAALFAVREWAMKVEQGELTEPEPKPKKSFLERVKQLLETIRETTRERKRLEEWKPRHIVVGTDIPSSGKPDDYLEGSPEKVLVEYLHYWSKRNYGYMAKLTSIDPSTKPPKRIKEHFSTKLLQSFMITNVFDRAAAMTLIPTTLVYKENDVEITKDFEFRLLYQNDDFRPVTRGKDGCRWVILNWNVY